ncbi:DUF2996 domain-containing protein [Trichocoleus sp. FACHB-591]|uniref:DUF2996 domain-containing protein n=1 Tax=Trichocoleus sp. FACHB-591 TaxID=2692872 RepID=UPI001685105F|nr:DUF2996 domain-containing protein [Trichocoleus sp. FACHB-591]MBD2095519.1 DUF2996 domain-containing protein [Trichocoleus sp. FACHB-591]
MAEPTNHNDAGEVAPSTVDQQAPDVAEENAPSTDEAVATDIPSANAPDPATANPDVNPNAAGEKPTTEASRPDVDTQTAVDKSAKSAKADPGPGSTEKAAAKKAGAAKAKGDDAAPAAKAKKEKAPAVEDKPFAEFVGQHYLPALKTALEKQGLQNLDLSFVNQKVQVSGLTDAPDCWQIVGRWEGGRRQFNIYFFKDDIQGQRGFSFSDTGHKASTLEPFLIDERKVTLDLLLLGAVQRLNAQKWLVRN